MLKRRGRIRRGIRRNWGKGEEIGGKKGMHGIEGGSEE